jgi:formamidopyrimidine-DNA glycosylase
VPELPDVEVYRRRIDPDALGRTIRSVELGDVDLREPVPASTLRSRLPGRKLTSTRRHGKFLFVGIEDAGWLLMHFGMTGEARLLDRNDDLPRHTRMTLLFEDGGRLAYTNMRKLGRLECVDDADAVISAEGLGPDPLKDGLDAATLGERLRGRRGTLKGALTDQGLIAGIGNIYADEVLLEAGLHPRTPVPSLNEEDVERIARAIDAVIAAAIEAEVDVDRLPDWFMLPHRDGDGRCPRCGAELERTRISGRSTYFCPQDQPG